MDDRRYYGLDALRGAMMLLGIILGSLKDSGIAGY